MAKLRTTSEVIDALGGNQALSDMTSTSVNGVYNWRAVGQFPADTYLLLKDALDKIDMNAPDHLWPMRQAPKKAARR
jgi:hypothetical protein